MEQIATEVIKEIKKRLFIETEASGRHVHLSRGDVDALFGKGYRLTAAKPLSQPGQYACRERVTLITEKGKIENVAVLGPEREHTQVEISLTDARVLGLRPPVRQSGDISGSPGITIAAGDREIHVNEGVIAAQRHIHITPSDAAKMKVCEGENVKVKIFGSRPLIFEDTVVRVSDKFATVIHIDYDEANACGFGGKTWGMVIK